MIALGDYAIDLKAHHLTMSDGFTRFSEFHSFITCNGVNTHDAPKLVQAIKYGTPAQQIGIIRTNLGLHDHNYAPTACKS